MADGCHPEHLKALLIALPPSNWLRTLPLVLGSKIPTGLAEGRRSKETTEVSPASRQGEMNEKDESCCRKTLDRGKCI